MSLKHKIIKNTIWNYFSQFWSILLGLILLPFIIHRIGIEAFGVWALVNAIVGYFGLIDLGIGASSIKYIAELNSKNDQSGINEIINSSILIYLFLGLVTSVFIFIIGHFLIEIGFDLPSQLINDAKLIVYILAIMTLVGFPLRIFGSILEGLQKYNVVAWIQIIVNSINMLLIIVFLSKGYGLIALVLITSLSSLIGWILTIYHAKKELPFIKINLFDINKHVLKKLFNYSYIILILQICGLLIYQTDRIIIGMFLTVGVITYYEIAQKIHNLVRMINGLTVSAVMPAASVLDSEKNIGAIQSLFLQGTKYAVAAILPIVIIIFIMAKPIIIYWIGPEFVSVTILTQVFIFYWLFNANIGIAGAILMGTGKLKLLLRYTISIAVLNLVLSVILVNKIGIIGVVLGTTIPPILGFPIIMHQILKILDLNWKSYFNEVIMKNYPIAILVAIILYVMSILHAPTNLIEVGIYGVITLICYYMLFYHLSSADEKNTFREIINMGKSKLGKSDQ